VAGSCEHGNELDFIHFWSVTLVNTIKTTSFTPPSVIKLHLLFAHAFICFGFLVNHLQMGLPRRPVLLEKPLVAQPLNGTRKFVTVYTRSSHWSLSSAENRIIPKNSSKPEILCMIL
jgi:hypothetical protein